VLVTIAPDAVGADGVPVQTVPGLSGGTPYEHAATPAGHTVVHLHGELTPASYDGSAENRLADRAVAAHPVSTARSCSTVGAGCGPSAFR
jgi:spore coat protein A